MEQSNFFEHASLATDEASSVFAKETNLTTSTSIEAVIRELEEFFSQTEHCHSLVAALSSAQLRGIVERRAQWAYANNQAFRHECKSRGAPGYLTGFVRTWISEVMKEWYPQMYVQLPVSFRVTGLPSLRGKRAR
ncbi:hypothetical protein [Paraburkholderia sp. SIMBA_054]|uniref:hypothetical protein n=1 Tax=Paraburkholderia sp. SIMBA_054 TaxID=3085795 RepID=UPI0039791355